MNYSLIQPRTGDNEGDRVEACGTGKDSGDTKVFKDKPWFQHVSSPTGWKFQVCKKKRFRGDECGAWQYFDTKGNAVQS